MYLWIFEPSCLVLICSWLSFMQVYPRFSVAHIDVLFAKEVLDLVRVLMMEPVSLDKFLAIYPHVRRVSTKDNFFFNWLGIYFFTLP